MASFGVYYSFYNRNLCQKLHWTVPSHSIFRLLAQGRCCRRVAAPEVVHTEVFWMTIFPCCGHSPATALSLPQPTTPCRGECGRPARFLLSHQTQPTEHCSLLPASVLTLSPSLSSRTPQPHTASSSACGETSHPRPSPSSICLMQCCWLSQVGSF